MRKRMFIIVLFFLCIFLVSGCFENSTNPGSNSTRRQTNSEKNFNSTQIDISGIKSYQDLVSRCKPAVVGIAALSGRYQSIGTGVCIKKGAYILTNNHVIENGNVINLYLSDGRTANASLVWKDPSSDLAMIKSNIDIPYLPVAESGDYQSGDEVVAIGTPLDLAFKHSVTKGIISAVNRTISVDNDFGETALYNLIQHDASINPGNSGGPLINMNGQVIGINTVKVTDAEGMGFAIPVDTFKPVIEKVSQTGSFETAYMGVFGYDNQLKNIGKISNGFYIESVAKNSPAEKIGLKKGDIITKINDIDINFAKDLKTQLYIHSVNDIVSLTIKNGLDTRVVQIKLEKHPYSYSKPKAISIKSV
ncbi:MAG TPA: hypothetical protein DCO89_02425 [Clostridiales bacterium]|nr:hypothetical protein [Clostridiales bacterium]